MEFEVRIEAESGFEVVAEHRAVLELAAFRRNSDAAATSRRTELPLMLGRLAAEVPGTVMELAVIAGADGFVRTQLAVEAGASTDELLTEAAALLEPIAELEPVADEHGPFLVWPFVSSARSMLGFGVEERGETGSVRWEATQPPDLIGLVNTHPDIGVRIRLRAGAPRARAATTWDAGIALLTTQRVEPPLRLRAQVRAQFPGLHLAMAPGGTAAAVSVTFDGLASLFAIPVAGEDGLVGVCVGAAAPLPIQPTRRLTARPGSVRLGTATTVAGRQVDVSLDVEERLRHVHVVGRTGTGKSSFLAGFAHEIALTDDGMLVLDPHGQLIDRIVAELPDAAAPRTWVVRCGDVTQPVPLNPLAVEDTVRREIAIDDVCGLFQFLFDKNNTGIVGPRFRERVAMGLRALVAVFGQRASLLDVPTVLSDRKFLAKAADVTQDSRLRAWLANDAANRRSSEYADLVSWVNCKFEAFSSTTAMRAILGSGLNAIDMAAAMDAGRIILIDLSKSALGESATALLGYLYLNRVWISALQRASGSRPFTVMVDEAQAMISGSLTTMLAEGRKFGLSVVLAHQYLGQLDEGLRPAIEGNVATTVAFRGSVADAPALRLRLGDRVDAATLMTLPDLSAVTLRTAAAVVAEPHTLTIDHNERITTRVGAEREVFESALTAATMRDLVDQYRDQTAAAGAGKSNVTQVPMAGVEPQRSRETPKITAPPQKNAAFLDEWLAARRAVSAEKDDPAEPVDRSAAVDSDQARSA